MGDQAVFFGRESDAATRLLTQAASVLETAVYRGPHYFSHTPMIRIQVDLGRLEDWPTNRIPGFADALLELLPGVGRHGCSLRVRGGFERRLREGVPVPATLDALIRGICDRCGAPYLLRPNSA